MYIDRQTRTQEDTQSARLLARKMDSSESKQPYFTDAGFIEIFMGPYKLCRMPMSHTRVCRFHMGSS